MLRVRYFESRTGIAIAGNRLGGDFTWVDANASIISTAEMMDTGIQIIRNRYDQGDDRLRETELSR
jgi:hypothetical protein